MESDTRFKLQKNRPPYWAQESLGEIREQLQQVWWISYKVNTVGIKQTLSTPDRQQNAQEV
jgi:hypothetical protein